MSTVRDVAVDKSQRAAERRPRARRAVLAPWTVGAAVDAVMLAIATATAAYGSRAAGVPVAPAVWLVAYPVLVLVLFHLRSMYAPRLRPGVLDDLRHVAAITAVAAMVTFSIRAVLHDDPFLAAQGIRQWLFAAVYLSCGRVLLSWAQRQAWARGDWVKPTLIIGAGHVGRLVAKRLLDNPDAGLKPIGFLDKEPLLDTDDGTDHLPVLGASWDLDAAIARYGVRHVVVTFSTAPHHVLLGIVNRCDELGVAVSMVPRLFEKVSERLTVEHLGGLPLLTVERTDPKGWQFAVKYAFDRVFAAIGLVVASPVLGAGALAVRVSMGRPVLYRQERVGLDGRTFEILKFRSMTPPAPGEGTEVPSGEDGDESHRLTRVGAALRATSIDELPQLFNVLRGDMSLVGPRPERPEFAAVFARHVHRYGDRHRVKSGITGWAQVHGIGRGSDRFSTASLGDRVEWDNYYIENWSLWLDVKILLMTAAAVLHFRQS